MEWKDALEHATNKSFAHSVLIIIKRNWTGLGNGHIE
jgi:hypothetical protein